MKEVIAKLGELVKADERCTRIQSTISDYEHSEELTALIGEYNTQQNLLADAYNKPSASMRMVLPTNRSFFSSDIAFCSFSILSNLAVDTSCGTCSHFAAGVPSLGE